MATKQRDLSPLEIEILSGEYDQSLLDLNETIIKRLTHSDIARRWRIEWTTPDGLEVTVTEDDLTITEAAKVEAMTRLSWGDLNPIKSATETRALLMVVLCERHGMSADQASDVLAKLTTTEAVECISHYQVSPAPLDAADSTTTG